MHKKYVIRIIGENIQQNKATKLQNKATSISKLFEL